MTAVWHVARLMLATAIYGSLIWFLGRELLAGLRTGSIAHGPGRRLCRRADNPLGFWLLMALFLCFALLAGWGWYLAVWQAA